MKIHQLIFIVLFLFFKSSFGQSVAAIEKFALSDTLNESSGLIFYNGFLITHNDSGNDNVLYEVDTTTGFINRTILIENAINKDWEDITQDDQFIYVGDIGNNSGNRTDLRILKIEKSSFANNDTVQASIINYQYADQVNFTPNSNNTPWDAEALCSVDDSTLIVFTKDWVNGFSKAYRIPKDTGSYSVYPLADSLDANGLITGASINQLNQLYLIGYTHLLQPFLIVSPDFSIQTGFSGTSTRIAIDSISFEQVEGLTWIRDNYLMATSETITTVVNDYAKLLTIDLDNVVANYSRIKNKYKVYPNPIQNRINILGVNTDVDIRIYNNNCLIYKGLLNKFNPIEISNGLYHIEFRYKNEWYKSTFLKQ